MSKKCECPRRKLTAERKINVEKGNVEKLIKMKKKSEPLNYYHFSITIYIIRLINIMKLMIFTRLRQWPNKKNISCPNDINTGKNLTELPKRRQLQDLQNQFSPNT